MNAANEQIVAMFESGDLTVEELATAFPELDIEAIKMVLAAGSSKFRAAMKKDKSLFSDEILDTAVGVMGQLLYAEEPTVRMRASKFIINEKMGRHDTKNIKNLNVNVNLINLQLAQARKAIEESKKKTINIEAQPVAA